MRIVVTGGSGFIGSHVVDKLIEEGYEVIIIDEKKPYQDDVKFENFDLLDFDNLNRAFNGVDCVFHLAAVSNVNNVFSNPIYSTEMNTVGTVKVLQAARQNKVKRVVFASTVWVYGASKEDEVNENCGFYLPGAGHLYTSTKIASELFCFDYYRLYGQPFTILRYGIPYGPRARGGTVMPIFVEKALRGEPIVITGDGSQYRNFLYVEDLAQAHIAALSSVAENSVYNLGGKRRVTIREVAETIQKLVNNNVEIRYTEARPGDYRGKIANSDKAKRELGWEARVDFEEGMRRYIQWYKETRNIA